MTLIIIDDNGCNDTIQDSVYVYCLPNPNFSAVPVCQGTDVFTNNSYPLTLYEHMEDLMSDEPIVTYMN